MTGVEAILFDGDGTLYDTQDYVNNTLYRALEIYGCPRPLEKIESVSGLHLRTCYEILAPGEDIDRICQIHDSLEIDYLHLAQPFPSATEVLAGLHQKGKKLALVTSRYGPTLKILLQTMDMEKYFQIIVDAKNVAKQKPDPEPVNKALEALQVLPNKAAMVGDTWVDIAAGKAARLGMTIGFTPRFGKGNFNGHEPDHYINHLKQILDLVD